MDGGKTTFLLGRPIFGGYVSFREGKNRLFFHSRHCHRISSTRSSWPSFGVWHWSWVLVHRSWVDATVRLRPSTGTAGCGRNSLREGSLKIRPPWNQQLVPNEILAKIHQFSGDRIVSGRVGAFFFGREIEGQLRLKLIVRLEEDIGYLVWDW